jgi:hypothetical protein
MEQTNVNDVNSTEFLIDLNLQLLDACEMSSKKGDYFLFDYQYNDLSFFVKIPKKEGQYVFDVESIAKKEAIQRIKDHLPDATIQINTPSLQHPTYDTTTGWVYYQPQQPVEHVNTTFNTSWED